MKIVAEDKILDGRIEETLAEWEANKCVPSRNVDCAILWLTSCLLHRPIQGQVKAEQAMNTINIFEARIAKLQEDFDLIRRAKDVRLSLTPVALPVGTAQADPTHHDTTSGFGS